MLERIQIGYVDHIHKWACHELTKLQHVAFIKQEHIVFSACVKACLSAVSTHAIASSLVFGDRFIHSYSFGWDEKKMPVFLILHTYSRDGDTCYQHVFIGDLENVVRRTSNYLQVGCIMACVSSYARILTLKFKLED